MFAWYCNDVTSVHSIATLWMTGVYNAQVLPHQTAQVTWLLTVCPLNPLNPAQWVGMVVNRYQPCNGPPGRVLSPFSRTDFHDPLLFLAWGDALF